ncbi:hypothetical protein [Tardiphaga sp.]|uniref:hypothetical protein n=1 Tax=Tardiphaga sp. TaxID=1926292 RepID=UPI00261901ED|nr:hypothetical protein [Tardiphaga sp.]MDB5615812.1 hypothetical protein [Tardiphaga sp.]
MNVSSVSAASAVVELKPIEAPPTAASKDETDRDDSRVAPPPPRAALPPGQGTRIDLLV